MSYLKIRPVRHGVTKGIEDGRRPTALRVGHPPKQAELGVTWRFKRGADGRSLGREVVGRVGGGLDTLGRLPLPAPTSAPWEWGRGGWTVSLRGETGKESVLVHHAPCSFTHGRFSWGNQWGSND